MNTVPALEFRRRFGEVLDEVVRTRQPITITRANKPLVVLVPADQYAAGAGAGAGTLAVRGSRLRLAAERVADWKARHAGRLRSLDPVALVREARKGR